MRNDEQYNGQRQRRPAYDHEMYPPPRGNERPTPPVRRPPAAGQNAYRAQGQQNRPPRAASPAQRRPPARNAGRPTRRKKRPAGCIFVSVLLVVSILAVGVFALINVYMNRIDATQTNAGTLDAQLQTLPEFKGDEVSFLVCGLDYDDETATGFSSAEKVGHTDMILYVYYKVKEGKVAILQIPRDTFVGGDAQTGGTGKINGLYYCAQDTGNRMQALAGVINDQLKLPIDFYVTIDMDAVKALVEVQGSIEVYVPMDVIDPDTTSRIEAGWRHLNGEQLEFLLRNRTSPNYNEQGDIARLRMQQQVYSALFRELKQLTPTDLLMWMNLLTYYCKTDMNLLDLGGIAQSALKLQSADITLVRPPCGAATYNGRALVSLEAQPTAELLNQYFRPEGQSYGVTELNIHELPMNVGVVPAEIKSMADIQQNEPENEG